MFRVAVEHGPGDAVLAHVAPAHRAPLDKGDEQFRPRVSAPPARCQIPSTPFTRLAKVFGRASRRRTVPRVRLP